MCVRKLACVRCVSSHVCVRVCACVCVRPSVRFILRKGMQDFFYGISKYGVVSTYLELIGHEVDWLESVYGNKKEN